MESLDRLIGGFLTLLGPRIGHHGHGQLEVGRQFGPHRNLQRVGPLLQRHEAVIENLGPLVGDQGQGRRLAPEKLDLGRVADFERVAVGEDPQAHPVFLAGDRHHVFAGNDVVEAVRSHRPADILASFFQAQRLPRVALLAGFQRMLLDEPLAHLAINFRPPQHPQGELARDRFAFGVERAEGDFKRFASHVDRADRFQLDREALGGEEEVDRPGDAPLRQGDRQGEDLAFEKIAGGEFELHLAFLVGGGGVGAFARKLIRHLAAGQGRAVVELRPNLALDLFSAVIDVPRRVDDQADRLQLVLLDKESALVLVLLVIGDEDAVFALGTGFREDKMRVEAAELAQGRLFFAEQTVPRIEGLERDLLSLGDNVAVVGHAPQAAADVDQVARPVGGPVRVDIAAIGQPLGDADALEADDVGGDVPRAGGEDPHVAGIAELLEGLVKHAVLAGGRLGEDLCGVGDQEPRARPGLAREHVLGKDEHFVARALDDDVQIALDHERRGFECLAADRDGHHAGRGIFGKGHFDGRRCLLILGVSGNREFKGGIRVDQGDVELFHARGQVHLAEVGLHVDLVCPNGHRLDVPRRELDERLLITAENPLGGDRQALGGQPGDRLLGLSYHRPPVQLLVLLERFGEPAEFLFERRGDHVLAAGRLVRLGIFRHQAAPIGDRRIPFLLVVVYLAEGVENRRVALVERVLGQERRIEF